MLPASMIGVALGWATASVTSDAVVRLIVGSVALVFTARALFGRFVGGAPGHHPRLGWVFGAIAGFTSFVAHAGGPLFQVHVLPKRLEPKLYTGTSVTFFAALNAAKVVPYAALGLFKTEVLLSALLMLPPAVAAVWFGAWIIRRMTPAVFYPFTYALIALVGLRLVWHGFSTL